jgi:hypothetical protein
MVQLRAAKTDSSRASFMGRLLLGSLALSLAVASFVGLSTASADSVVYTYHDDDLCNPDGLGPRVSHTAVAGGIQLLVDFDVLAASVSGDTRGWRYGLVVGL